MSVQDLVREARSPQDAMMALAYGIDVILQQINVQPPPDPWGEWGVIATAEPTVTPTAATHPDQPRSNFGAIVTQEDEDSSTIDIVPPSAKRMAARHAFATQYLHFEDFPEFFPEGEDWLTAYMIGGPLWLYNGNDEFVRGLPDETRRGLVRDLQDDGYDQEAQEMARDILKEACEDGPGSPAMQIADG